MKRPCLDGQAPGGGRPTAGSSDLKRYELGVGHLTVDLHRLSLPAGDTRLRARVGVGRLDLYVPDRVAVRVDGKVNVGDADVLGRHDSGTQIREQVSESGPPGATSRLMIDAKVGVGDLNIRRGAP